MRLRSWQQCMMSDDHTEASEAQYIVRVRTQSRVARIAGGGGEVWVGRAIILNAFASRDLNLDPASQQELEFAWACSTPYGALAGLVRPCVYGQILELSISPMITVAPCTLPPSLHDTLPNSSHCEQAGTADGHLCDCAWCQPRRAPL